MANNFIQAIKLSQAFQIGWLAEILQAFIKYIHSKAYHKDKTFQQCNQKQTQLVKE
jgi:hypothetical protein